MGADAAGAASYPMVEEADATGVVAAVYADLLEGMPFVPSLFKSLALCPGCLVLAHEQAVPVLSTDEFGSAAQRLVTSVRDVAEPPADADVRAALAGFAGPLSRMLLLAAGLRLALDGELDLPSAPGHAPAPRPVQPREPAPSPADAPAPQVYGEICAALETPIVNTVWRSLAARDLLEPAWAALRPQVEVSRPAADHLQARASEVARGLPWRVAASPAALEHAGVTDARPGMAAVLDAYRATLPRVLVLVASSADAG
ncbi:MULTISPECIES: hypothetical protein [unclassified Modestobacter]|uniref:hypothetical protein n=1 Tax=unclassified Modestobacter TaxID=2643866 RepID=UPI0022AB0378|nr:MULTISPECIES: hypothetical protein [unclassified Modestobacter]MCZ2824436.1 hypothetical protein [Modestobacter sp. VKM Ac-2981]MCZ2854036.1 hypothetical protein [Modestobacter sp. VKM Ac-2982]